MTPIRMMARIGEDGLYFRFGLNMPRHGSSLSAVRRHCRTSLGTWLTGGYSTLGFRALSAWCRDVSGIGGANGHAIV